MNIEKRRPGRPNEKPIPPAVIDEIIRFCDLYPSVHSAAKALDVSPTSVWAWREGRFRPSDKNAKKMQDLSRGLVNSKFILCQGRQSITKYPSLREHIINEHLVPMADALGLNWQDFALRFYALAFVANLDKDSTSFPSFPYSALELHLILGLSLDYWVEILAEFASPA